MYTIVVLNKKSTRENPIMPKEFIASPDELTTAVSRFVDSDNYVVISHIPQVDDVAADIIPDETIS